MADPTAEFEQYIEWFEEEPNDRKYVEAFAVNVYAMREIIAQALRIARVVTQPSDDEARELGNTAIEEGAHAHEAGLNDDEADEKAGRLTLELLLALAEKGI